MRSSGRWALAGLVAILAIGCGTATDRSNRGDAGRTPSVASYGQAAEGSCTTIAATNGRPVNKTSCVFELADGRRFTCPESFAHAVQTASSLEHSTACRAIASLHLSAAVRRMTAVIESAQACLISHKVRAIGGGVLPPGADPSTPDGELIAGYLPSGALIAFYRDAKKAARLEPPVIRNARRIHARVERNGAETILWLRAAATLRRAVMACLRSA